MKMLSFSVLVEAPQSIAASIHRHSSQRYERLTWPWTARSTFSKGDSDFQENHWIICHFGNHWWLIISLIILIKAMKIINSQVQIFNPRVILPFLELMMRTLFLPDGGFYMLDRHTHCLESKQPFLFLLAFSSFFLDSHCLGERSDPLRPGKRLFFRWQMHLMHTFSFTNLCLYSAMKMWIPLGLT